MWPADSGAEGPYDMSTKKEKMFGRPRLATGVSSSGGVHRGGRWIASVINDIRQWQLSINNSWTTSHHEDRLRDTRHSHSRRDNLQRIVCQGSSDDGRPLEFFEVCDAPTENRPCPICKIPICDCCRLRGALCMCGESCELPKNQVTTLVMISRSSQCDLRRDCFGACCSSITGSSLRKACDDGSDVSSSDADRGTTMQSDSFEETSEASVANHEGDAIDPEYELDSVDLFPFGTFFDGACGEPSVAVGGVGEFLGEGNFEACGAETSIGCESRSESRNECDSGHVGFSVGRAHSPRQPHDNYNTYDTHDAHDNNNNNIHDNYDAQDNNIKDNHDTQDDNNVQDNHNTQDKYDNHDNPDMSDDHDVLNGQLFDEESTIYDDADLDEWESSWWGSNSRLLADQVVSHIVDDIMSEAKHYPGTDWVVCTCCGWSRPPKWFGFCYECDGRCCEVSCLDGQPGYNLQGLSVLLVSLS